MYIFKRVSQIQFGIVPLHLFPLYALSRNITEMMSLKPALCGGVFSLTPELVWRVGGAGREHVLTSLSDHPSVNLVSQGGLGSLHAYLLAGRRRGGGAPSSPAERRDFALRSLHAWAQVALSVCVDAPASFY